MEGSIFSVFSYFFSGMLIGSFIFYIYQVFFKRKREKFLQREVNRILNKAKSEAYRIEKKAEIQSRDFKLKMKKETEERMQSEMKKLEEESKKLQILESELEEDYSHKTKHLETRVREYEESQKYIKEKTQNLDSLQEKRQKKIKELSQRLESISEMSQEEAKKELKKTLEEEVKTSLAPQLKKIEDDLKKESDEKCRSILASALARQASAVTTEKTIERLTVSGDDDKGKIIGREGRNIRALEYACGVDILIEEGQGSILICCFDPIRREVAKRSITLLIKHGRVHPSRIEEIVEKVKTEIFSSIKEEGERVCFELNVHDVHPEIIKTLGGLSFKTIDGQNALESCQQMARLAGHIMSEIGGDDKKAKRAALLMCIGLNLDHRVDGSYAEAGAQFCKSHREKQDIVHAILCHTSQVEAQSVLDHVVQTTFNLYQSLSGSKKTNIESFITRMKKVESIANSFSGVMRSFAIQSGKELRVLVDSSHVTDDQTRVLCMDIAKKIEREFNHHQIRVSVIRESRIIEHAR